MTDTEALLAARDAEKDILAAALISSGLMRRYRDYASRAFPATLENIALAELADDWAKALYVALHDNGQRLLAPTERERARLENLRVQVGILADCIEDIESAESISDEDWVLIREDVAVARVAAQPDAPEAAS